jgi:protein ImuB
MFACLIDRSSKCPPVSELVSVGQVFSPRVERAGSDAVVCDLTGLERLFGTARVIGEEVRREAADRGLAIRVAVAATRTAARLLAYGRSGLTVVERGRESEALASLPLSVLGAMLLDDRTPASVDLPLPARFYRTSPMEALARQRSVAGSTAKPTAELKFRQSEDLLATLSRWGLKTLGDLTALPPAQLSERLGQDGVALQRLARGEDEGPLVPLLPDERFEACLDLEWPIDGLEPLSFVLGRLLDPVCEHLERRGRAAAATVVELRLTSRDMYVRRLQLPVPLRDARVLRTLMLLDLESHPPGAGIDAVTVRLEPTPGRVLQYSLIERAQPAPEQISTLIARLTALMGQDRCGSPQLLDTYRPGAFTMAPFAVDQRAGSSKPLPSVGFTTPPVALRRYRQPVPIRVAIEQNRPARVMSDRVGLAAGHVEACAGPWRTSGEWWTDGWHRDEWDVALDDGTVCRIFRDRETKWWFMDAIMD